MNRFLLCPSADSSHKNNEKAVRAFDEFNKAHEYKYTLVITSEFSDRSKAMLSDLSANLVFTGHVLDSELGWLFENCAALLFVSAREGLGLPILEAVEADKKIVCSNLDVFTEISENAFYLADPNDISSITQALTEALIDEKDWNKKKKLYGNIKRTFSWESTAKACLENTKQKIKNPDSTSSEIPVMVSYADGDQYSLPRDLAEVLYAKDETILLTAMRNLNYQHLYPSYLIEMGVATNALQKRLDQPLNSNCVYIIDDSVESAKVLLYALQIKGLIIATFGKGIAAEEIETFFSELIGKQVDTSLIFSILEETGNKIVYESNFSERGTKAFIEEATTLRENIEKEKLL